MTTARRGRRRLGRRGFGDALDEAVTDEEQLERIRELATPPGSGVAEHDEGRVAPALAPLLLVTRRR